ncbi:MAG: phosphate ABC transporter permease, partial [Candidatus Thermoplasmatota archaeon]
MNTTKKGAHVLTNTKRNTKEKVIKSIFFTAAIFGVITIFSILFFLLAETYPLPTDVWSFLSGTRWSPTESLQFGTYPLLVGTLLVTFGAMALAIPLSIGGALFLSEIASSRVRSIIKPAIELLAGIPSVVYGFFGLILLT